MGFHSSFLQSLFAAGHDSRLLVIEICVAIGKEQGLEWRSDGVLQVLLTSSFDNEGMTAVYQRR